MDRKQIIETLTGVANEYPAEMVQDQLVDLPRIAFNIGLALEGRNTADFVTELAVPVPMRIIADMLGVADGDLGRFREWSDAMANLGGGPQ